MDMEQENFGQELELTEEQLELIEKKKQTKRDLLEKGKNVGT